MSAPSPALAVIDDRIAQALARSGWRKGQPEPIGITEFRATRNAVAELIAADDEYEAARRDWDHVTAHDPEETSDETWRRVADRFEAAVMRRAAALANVKGVQS